jgi:hypothetical protein
MKNIKFTFALLLILSGLSFSQQIVGKIYAKQDADNIYGPVLSSIPVNSTTLTGLLSNSTNYIMFRIDNGAVYIIDNNRRLLYGGSISVNPNDVYRLFSISLVGKIIQDGKCQVTYIENRNNNILTITNGLFTLEVSNPCPPYCD